MHEAGIAEVNTEADILQKIPAHVARELGWYVYLFIDPRNGRPFYVGKGRRKRIYSHFDSQRSGRKEQVLAELKSIGLEPVLEILSHKIPNEEIAFRIESASIDLLGLDSLSNQVRGKWSVALGRMNLRDVIAQYSAKPVKISDPVILIRINQLFRSTMTQEALYEATRGVWKLGQRCENAKYALAVFEGVVREAYVIHEWFKAGTMYYKTRQIENRSLQGRKEFQGKVAEHSIRNKYVGKSVENYFSKGQQSPVKYVNVPITSKTILSKAN